MTLIDSHAHLEMPDYDTDRDDIIKRALSQSIEKIITIGIGMKECRQAIEIARIYPGVYAAVGLHPHNAKKMDAKTIDFIRTCACEEKVVAIGEMGLDFFKNWSPRKDQIRSFHEQLALAREIRLPVIIHDRDAHTETVRILKEDKAEELGGVIHCFSGDFSMASTCIDMGFYISIPGTITFNNASGLADVVKKLPLNCLLIETDAPFLAPVPYRGKRNEPAYVKHVAEKIAEIKNIPFDEVAHTTTKNAAKLFKIK